MFLRLVAGLLALAAATFSTAHAQVKQSGNVTPGHAVRWISSGVIGDAGTATQGFLSSIGVTNNGGPGICVNTAPITQPYNQLCLQATTDGNAQFSYNAFGGATGGGLTFVINGVTQGIVTVDLPVTAGDAVCFANTGGTLEDCGAPPGNGRGYYYVTNYGALCDGSTDDGTAFRAAEAAAVAGGGGTIMVPAGTCKLGTTTGMFNTALALHSKVSIQGAGVEATILKPYAESVIVLRIVGQYSSISDLALVDGTFNTTSAIRLGQLDETSTTTRIDIQYNSVTNVFIRQFYFCVTLAQGPTVAAVDSYLYTNTFTNVNCNSNVIGFYLKSGPGKTPSGSNRNNFFAISATGSGTCIGFFIDDGSAGNYVVGARFEGIDGGGGGSCSESATPAGVRTTAGFYPNYFAATFENAITTCDIYDVRSTDIFLLYNGGVADGVSFCGSGAITEMSPSGLAFPRNDVIASVPTRLQGGVLNLLGSTSGTLVFRSSAAAGSNTVTWPAGTTDFSATGGTSQVVKQTSAGGAFTVGQLTCSDLSSGCVSEPSGTGLVTKTGSGTYVTRSVVGTTNEIDVTNGAGTAGNVTLSLATAMTFTGKTITGGTFASPGFSGTATGANTLPITLLASPGTAANGFQSDGTSVISIPRGPRAVENCSISGSVSGNALTVSLLSAAGSTPSASNPCTISFRNVTIATGSISTVLVTAATTFVTGTTGATFGSSSTSVAFRLWVTAWNNGGTVVIGVSNQSVTNGATGTTATIYPLNEETVQSSTACNACTNASSAGVFYTTATQTSKAIRVLGYLEWGTGLATAGTYASGPTTILNATPATKLPGAVVQTIVTTASNAATTTSTTYVCNANYRPAITPTSAANIITGKFVVGSESNSANTFLLIRWSRGVTDNSGMIGPVITIGSAAATTFGNSTIEFWDKPNVAVSQSYCPQFNTTNGANTVSLNTGDPAMMILQEIQG